MPDAAVRYDSPRRRAEDDSELARVTGYSNVRSLLVNVIGGLSIASIVGALSIWGTQLVLGEQIESLTHQLRSLREEVRDMRRDLYQPRYRERSSAWRPWSACPDANLPCDAAASARDVRGVIVSGPISRALRTPGGDR